MKRSLQLLLALSILSLSFESFGQDWRSEINTVNLGNGASWDNGIYGGGLTSDGGMILGGTPQCL